MSLDMWTRYKPWTDTYVFTCLGCGKNIETNSEYSPLDNLGCCSVECDRKVEADLVKRLGNDPEWKALLEQEGLI
jgi:hypothetical protein